MLCLCLGEQIPIATADRKNKRIMKEGPCRAFSLIILKGEYEAIPLPNVVLFPLLHWI